MNATMHTRALWAALAAILVLQVIGWTGSCAEIGPSSVSESALVDIDARLQRLEHRMDEGFTGAQFAGRVAPGVDELERHAVSESPTAMPVMLAELSERVAALEAAAAIGAPDATEPRDVAAERELIGRLNAALAGGDEREIARLLALDLALDRRDEDGRTPLAAAAIAGRLADMETLLAGGARLERKAQRGMTPLLAALDAGQEDAALRLLDRGASVTAVDKNGEGVLIWAAFNGLDRVAERAIQLGVEVDHQAHDGATALIDASRRGHIGLVRRLLASGANPSLANKAGRTALAFAVEKGHDAIAALLRQHGAR